MKKLNNRELFNLDQELFNFRGIDRAIWTRKAELMAKNGDDLVGGGKSGISKPTENTVMKFATDVTLKNLELFKETVESFKKQLNIRYVKVRVKNGYCKKNIRYNCGTL